VHFQPFWKSRSQPSHNRTFAEDNETSEIHRIDTGLFETTDRLIFDCLTCVVWKGYASSFFAYALSVFRPLRRLFLMMVRPDLVDILLRKPCFIFRLRLFG
jgi:hypothetical protein